MVVNRKVEFRAPGEALKEPSHVEQRKCRPDDAKNEAEPLELGDQEPAAQDGLRRQLMR